MQSGGNWLVRMLEHRSVCLFLAGRIVGISVRSTPFSLDADASRIATLCTYYGLDPMAFQNVSADRLAFRSLWDLPWDASILLFGARIFPEGNPVFAV